MKKNNKIKLFGGFCLATAAVLLTGCNSFCSSNDKANIAYPIEQGVTVYCNKDEIPDTYKDVAKQVFDDNENLFEYVPVDENGNFTAKKSTFLVNTILAQATKNNYTTPSQDYFIELDKKVLECAIQTAITNQYSVNNKTITNRADLTAEDINAFVNPDSDGEDGVASNAGILRVFGYQKFLGTNETGEITMWSNYDTWNNELRVTLGSEKCPTIEFTNLYKTQIETKLNTYRSCVTTRDGSKYGHYGNQSNWEVTIEKKTYADAWSKGFLEGLIVYPVAWMVDTFAFGMDPALSGVGQIWSIIFVTLIVRTIVLLLTFKSTLDQQRMQTIQPEIAKIQAKYPNSNTNTSEKTRMQQEQMALYRRNKISPFSSIITLIIQFPVFIAVWNALQGSAVLSSGAFLNLRLSDSIKDVLFNTTGTWYLNTTGWWSALVLFIIMAASQFLAMMLPQWINKRKQKNITKLSKNPAQDKTNSQMKWIGYGMLIFTIITGFFLPAAMGVYWAIGAFISMGQTAITQLVLKKSKKIKK